MNRQEILAELNAFPYDRAGYWVVTGGAMALYGVRKETGDIDLGCTRALADRLAAEGYPYRLTDDGRRWFRYSERIEIFEEWLYDRTETVDGFRVISLEGLIEMKTALGREKDLRDVERIRAFQSGKGAAMEEQIITITVKTKGEPCELTDEQIRVWYAERIAALFDPKWGVPEIAVDVERKQG